MSGHITDGSFGDKCISQRRTAHTESFVDITILHIDHSYREYFGNFRMADAARVYVGSVFGAPSIYRCCNTFCRYCIHIT